VANLKISALTAQLDEWAAILADFEPFHHSLSPFLEAQRAPAGLKVGI
jgi:hypothetical protein